MKVIFFASEGFDYLSNQLTEGFHLLAKQGKIEFICTEKCVHHGSMIEDLTLHSFEDACKHLDDAKYIIFSSGGDYRFNSGQYGSVFNDEKYAKKRIFIDGHDSNQYLCDPGDQLVYFKRELRYPEASRMLNGNIRSLTFGVYQFLLDQSHVSYEQRDIDIAFVAFGGSNPIRQDFSDRLKSRVGISDKLKIYTNVSNNSQPLSITEYRDILRHAKVGVSLPGAGFDTLRFWETMGQGAVLASIDISRYMYLRDSPEPNREAIYFTSYSEFISQATEIVLNKKRWCSLSNASLAKVNRCHSTITRAMQVLQIAEELE